jgi:hypothetical protein
MMTSADFKSSNRNIRISSDAGVCQSSMISSVENSSNLKIKIYSSKYLKRGIGLAKYYIISIYSR